MTDRQRHSVLLSIITFFAFAATAQADDKVPDANPFMMALPEAAAAPAPKIIKPGTRLIYYGQSASISGSRTQLVPEYDKKKQQWILVRNGQGLREEQIPNVGGAGYSVARVGHVDRKLVTIMAMNYVIDPLAKTSTFTSSLGIVTNAGYASDYWINPKVLGKIKERNADGVIIMRMPYPLNGKTYNAIRFQTNTKTGYQAYMYDLDTGLMIFHGSSSQGASVIRPPLGGDRTRIGKGATTLVNGWLMEVKQVDMPWQDAAAPKWVGQFRQLRYDGAQTSALPGLQPFSRPVSLIISPKARGQKWLRFTSDVTIANQPALGIATPPEKYHTEQACGNASAFGMWIPPKAIGKLQQGQTLETNKITRTKIAVSEVGGNYVTITEFGQLHRIDYAYDRNTGMLRGIQIGQQIGQGTMTTRLGLSGQR